MHIKEENVRDEHCREKHAEMDAELERLMKESSEKQRGREADKEDHSMGDSSKEVRKAGNLQHLFSRFTHETTQWSFG